MERMVPTASDGNVRELLFLAQQRGVEVAFRSNPCKQVLDREDEGLGVARLGGRFDLLPFQRRRGGRALLGPDRVDAGGRLFAGGFGPSRGGAGRGGWV